MATRTTTTRTTQTGFVQSGDYVSLEEVFQAYLDCREGKRNKPGTIIFENNLRRNLIDLKESLNNNTYRIGTTDYFILSKPKYREVWAACFRDRIVHRIIYNRVCQKYFRRFIFDSYACIPGKGPDKATKRLQSFLRGHNSQYFLQADIKNFFVSIDKNILWDIVQGQMEGLDNLMYYIIFHDPTADYIFKGDKNLRKFVPKHKSLFNTSKDCGLPIGNLTSQLLANIYLDKVDKYVKHVLKCKKYIRYVDDLVILDSNPSKLHSMCFNLESFLNNQLGLEFHPNKIQINKSEHGINFTGKIVKKYCMYPRKRVLNNLYSVDMLQDNFTINGSINSYIGILRQSNSWKIRSKLELYLNYYAYLMDWKLSKMVKPVRETNLYRLKLLNAVNQLNFELKNF